MKNLLTKFSMHGASILVILMVVFGTFQPLIAQAQSDIASPLTGGNTDSRLSPAGSAAAASPSGSVVSTPQGGGGIDSSSSLGCNLGTLASAGFGSTFALCLTNVVYIFTVGIGSGFAYVSAYFFDFAISLSLNSAAYALSFVSQGWTTARDLANMAFLFILIYIAFMIMFEAESSGTVQLLAGVIVVALLVNFSFFFTRLAIDAGNILSIQFYNAITAPSIASSAASAGVQSTAASAVNTVSSVAGTTGFGTSKDLTASIMGMLQLQNLFNTQSFQTFFQPNGTQASAGFMVTTIALSFLYIAAAIMFWLLTIMFATAGVKFLFRIVALWFLIIASPLAFVARAVPNLKKYFDQWLSLLISNSFYPVAFMFIFLVLTNFANQMSGSCITGQTTCNGLINGIFDGLSSATNASSAVAQIGYAAANVGIRMGFVIAILWVGLEVSKRLGVMGGEAANKFGGWAGGAMKGTISGAVKYGPGWATGAAYRKTVGAGANLIDRGLQGSRWANETGTFGGVVGYRLRKNVLAPLKETSLGTYASSYNERDKFLKTRKGEMDNNLRTRENADILKDAGTAIADNISHNRAALSNISDANKNRIQNLNKNELQAFKADDLKKVSAVFSEDQIKKIADLEKLTDKDKEEIRTEWARHAVSAPLQKAINKLKDLQVANPAVQAFVTNTRNNNTMIDGGWTNQLKQMLQAQHSAATAAWNQPGGRNTQNHTAMQEAQDALSKLKEFDENRKNIEPNEKINNNGVKGTFNSSLIP